ncbi:unnamed protein product [Nesidiocoris tenuis]|uniref:AAA+ ATPase domain-containing protein n=1 Tax=Nesidiocoris tenuis TaxID=355587 RepID=A0A6H5GUY1_9HEMI|nr:unnamed protein product [Nesidiocoris tenuis]
MKYRVKKLTARSYFYSDGYRDFPAFCNAFVSYSNSEKIQNLQINEIFSSLGIALSLWNVAGFPSCYGNTTKLLSGEYAREKKEEEKAQKIKRREEAKLRALKKQEEEERKLRWLISMQASCPIDPDDQRTELLSRINIEMNKPVKVESLRKIYELINCTQFTNSADELNPRNSTLKIDSQTQLTNWEITNDMVEPFNVARLEDMVTKLSTTIKIVNRHFVAKLKNDLMDNYYLALRTAIVEYVLKDPEERKRLNIETMPYKFPTVVIRAPVPWHASTVVNSQRFDYRFYGGHPVVLKIRELFEENWLEEVANILRDMKNTWVHLGPKKGGDSQELILRFFSTINSLISHQLRSIVINSIKYYYDFLRQFQDGNHLTSGYVDYMFPRLPFLTVKAVLDNEEIIAVTPNSVEIRNTIKNVFPKILHVSKSIPVMQNYVFQNYEGELKYILPVRSFEKEVTEMIKNATDIYVANSPGAEEYLDSYDEYQFIFDGTAQDLLNKRFAAQPFPLLKEWARQIGEYDNLISELLDLRRNVPLNLINLDCFELNEALIQKINQLRDQITDYFANLLREHNTEIAATFENISKRASEMPETTAKLVELMNFILDSRDNTMYKMKAKLGKTAEYLLFLLEHAILPEEDIFLNAKVFVYPKDMEVILDTALHRINIQKEIVESALKSRRANFEIKLVEDTKLLETFRKKDPPILTMEEMATNVEEVDVLVKVLEEDKINAEAINTEEQLLGFDVSPFTNLAQMVNNVDPFYKLWHTVLDFHQSYDKWMYGPFMGLDAEEIKDTVENMYKTLYKLSKTFFDVPGSKRVAETVRAKVDKFKHSLPVLQAICTPGIQERHWKDVSHKRVALYIYKCSCTSNFNFLQISDAIGMELHPTEETTLADMIEYGLSKYIAKLEEVSLAASREFTLEKNLKKMKDEWAEVTFELMQFRDSKVKILSGVDDIQVMLDDHILKAQTMRGSLYVKPFEQEMQEWEEKLVSMQDILDSWIQVQITWMYLESIFGSEDIMRQMPEEARAFQKVDIAWKEIMINTEKDPNVLRATGVPKLLPTLKELNRLLEEIQKGLNDYLEKKRLFFPRFFFLSNGELLEMLSETKDPLRVQPHLKKCFEGIAKLDFSPEIIALGMVSAENETVAFVNQINPAEAKGLVEKWLAQVEMMMVASLKDICYDAVKAYKNTPRAEWVLAWPGMVIICASSVNWTTEVTQSIESKQLKKQVDKSNKQIDELVKIVRSDLNPGHRITIEALITIDVHARDVVKNLNDRRVLSTADFNWLSQLRYYCYDEVVHVCMITTDLEFGYEYLGNTPRLVITPLTDRCYRTLMGALKLHLGGAPEGPAGTGKTETTKDLAKAVAKQCVVFNCSDGLDYKAVGKFFKGLAQAGAWACFDEFNRIELEVLSVIATQVYTIQTAIIQKKKVFQFEGSELSLNPSCAVFITMNPGYAGRQELPDNLKVLFRSVAMMVPDYGLIGEISLYSKGFDKARSLAEKIVDTYKLCSEQLSSQSHYDYGMRAVKTVLTAAGVLKQKYLDQQEDIIVLRAIVDVNLPKFLAHDLPLFIGIYQDLFPGVVLPSPDRLDLIQTLKDKLAAKNLQATDWYMDKIIQVYEMILVRHGLMLVGEPLGGKTCAYQNLAEALTQISSNRKSAMKEFKSIYRIINPKSISMGQLYGQFDPVSHEWFDGILAVTFREFASSATAERKWIMFDGPVDAVWIENMNTVLDDNKKLCLMSGEIIQMSNKMNLIFEPADLEQASPATVSRCGMVYFEPKQLGWQPFNRSYLNVLKKKLPEEQFTTVTEMLAWLIQPTIDWIFSKAKLLVQSSELHLYQSFSRLFTCMLESGNVHISSMGAHNLQCLLVFCVAWGFGSILTASSKKDFEPWFRNFLILDTEDNPRPERCKLTKFNIFPEKFRMWDVYYDCSGNGLWIQWVDTLPRAVIPANAKISDVIVQTSDYARQMFFLKLLLTARVPVLFVGPTGTGKSSLVTSYLMSLAREKFLPNVLNFSARTSANQTQDIIMSKLDRRRKGVFGPSMGKLYLLFVDDMSMPQKEKYGAQPPIELLRQFIDHGHWYDLKNNSRLDLVDILFVGAMLPPGGGSNEVTSRFLRHMNIFALDPFDENTLTKIFTTILDWHFSKGFDEQISRYSKNLVYATMQVYQEAMANFLPTPSKSHYTFNLRDFSRVIRGVLLVPSSRMAEPEKLMRLWVHETLRVFGDRLTGSDDRNTLLDYMKTSCYKHIRTHMDQFLADLIPEGQKQITTDDLRNLFYGNYFDPDADVKIYDEINDMEVLEQRMNHYLKEYNMLSRVPMSLVMFKFVIEHISRISRIIQQDNGHVLLVGMGGSGRQSCTKLACHMAEYFLYQIEIAGNYGAEEWRDDLRALMKRAGVEGKPQVFLFPDSQIKSESFVEDINMILNTGDVPNLYGSEEKVEIQDKMTNLPKDSGKKTETSPLALYNLFIGRVKTYLHLALAMSPIGNAFRDRIRMFPSLINCCTIDWFTAWPDDALERVAKAFLQTVEINDELKEKSVVICKEFHNTVKNASEELPSVKMSKFQKSNESHIFPARYYEKLKRKNYVTPTSFLELIKTFQNLHAMKVDQITTLCNRYEVGLEKLDFAAGQVSDSVITEFHPLFRKSLLKNVGILQVAVMQEELNALQPELVKTSEETERLMVKIEQDTVIVEAKKEIVAADEASANEAAAAAQAIKDDCESDLAEAIPALEAAVQALNTLKPADITIVKSMRNPPAGVKLVMEAVCVMKGIKSQRIPDPGGSGKMVEDYWGPSQKLLGDLKFLESLRTYDKDNISPQIMKKIREKYIPDRDFDPDVIKASSSACEGLCKWVRSMEVYDRVNKIVAPKKAKYAEAEEELAVQMDKLNEKRSELQKVTDSLQALNDQYTAKTKEKKDLEDAISLCRQKLERAEKLIGGLGGEKARWSETARQLQDTLTNAVGDVLISSGVTAYLGAFTASFRTDLVRGWNNLCIEMEVPCSPSFSMISTLGDPITIRDWNIHGLPVDSFSIENGIIVSTARRWPLMIDPQGQANKWVKNMERKNKLSVVKQTDNNYLRVIERAIEHGLPVLLENILEEVDAFLEPILSKNIFKQGGREYLKVSDNILQYNSSFRFYMTTQLRNPHYMPETAVKVTLLNFMITQQGLQDQLLGIVVARERPELEEKKNELILESAENKRQLKELEDEILHVLSSAEGNILENESAIQTLSQSKILSAVIIKKQEVSATTEKEIDDARNLYVPVSVHSAVLFFCISELVNIDPMYQYSLVWFISLYNQAIGNSKKSDSLEERLSFLKDYFTISIYKNVCRSLFEKDKLTFSFTLTLGIQRAENKIEDEHIGFLLTGGISVDNPYPNPAPGWLSEKSWAEIVRASKLNGLNEFKESIQTRPDEWKEFYLDFDPISREMPSPMKDSENLIRLIILRCLRPDKLVPAVVQYITNIMTKTFVEPPSFNLAEAYDDSTCTTPLIFILSAGADPMVSLMKFAEQNVNHPNLVTISLGQGQGAIASKMIEHGLKVGDWVVLQNCHLAESWMKHLDKICSDTIMGPSTHKNFRLWLTSYPSSTFPVAILQNGVKMTNEAPQGLKANLYRSYTSDLISDAKFYEGCHFPKKWEPLLFSLCFFHAVVQERRHFGPLGWNVPYEFNDSDLRISILQLQMFLNEYEDVPYEALSYLTGECNYGGRVSDDKDRRLLNSLLSNFYCPAVLLEERYSFSPSGVYHLPSDTSYEGVLSYIESLPSNTPPEVFGLHDNADITKDNKATNLLLDSVLLTQAQVVTGAGGQDSTDTVVEEVTSDILNRLPPPFNVAAVEIKYPTQYTQSMNTVLRQEIARYNKLTSVIISSSREVQKAVKGLVVMSSDLEDVCTSIKTGRVPRIWATKSYPSLKPLAGYIHDLLLRLKFFQRWIDEGIPTVFWLSGFYFTQSFISGVLQNYSRRYKISIDQLGFQFEVTSFEEKPPQEPEFGVHVKGLFLEGARWNRDSMKLDESYHKVLFDVLPIIWFKPGIKVSFKRKSVYNCPLYRTSARRGVLATTGHSTNFVMIVDLTSDLPQKHWINRGVASLLQLDD